MFLTTDSVFSQWILRGKTLEKSACFFATVLMLFIVPAPAALADSGCYGGAPPVVPTGTPSNLPNIVYIMLDDGGYLDFSAYGCEAMGGNACDALANLTCPSDPAESDDDPWLLTPNIDAIAANGIRFTQHYMAPSCSPSRVGLLSGGYQQRQNVRRQVQLNQLQQYRGVSDETLPLPDMMRQLGYRTGHFGKWHAGYEKDEFRPLSLGFDEACTLLDAPAPTTGLKYCDPLVRDGNGTSSQVVTGYTTEILFDYAASFIERHAAANAPFFLQIWPWAPHAVWEFDSCQSTCPTACDDPCSTDPQCKERNIQCYLDDYANEISGVSKRFGPTVAKLDEQVGILREKIQSLGIADNTLFIVTNDNGGIEFGFHQSNGTLYQYKGEVFEGGTRAAFVADWNDGIAPVDRGETHEGPVMRFEIYPTFAEIAGADLTTLDFDGQSFAGVFDDPAAARASEVLFWEHQPSKSRFEDEDTLDRYRYNDFAVRRDDWKLVYDHDSTFQPSLELYDFADPNPDVNCLARPPEGPNCDVSAGNLAVVEALQEDYFDWRRETTTLPLDVNHDLGDIERVGRDMRLFGSGGFARLFETTRLDFADGHFSFSARVLPDAGSLSSGPPRWLAGKWASWELLLNPDGTVSLKIFGIDELLGSPVETFVLSSTETVDEAVWNTVAFDIYGWRDDSSELRLHVNGETSSDWTNPNTNATTHDIHFLSSNSSRTWVGGGWFAGDHRPFLGTLRDATMRVSSLYPEEVRRFEDGELFFDGFDTGTYDFGAGQIGGWDTVTNDDAEMSVESAAALFGSRGLRVKVDDPSGEPGDRGFLSTLAPAAESRIRVSVRVDLRAAAIEDGDTQRLVVGRTADAFGQPGFANTLMLVARKSGNSHEVQAWARLDVGGWAITDWVTLEEGLDDGLGTVELEWRAASSSLADGHIRVSVVDGGHAEVGDLNNPLQVVERIDLGIIDSVTYTQPTTEGVFDFDFFELYKY